MKPCGRKLLAGALSVVLAPPAFAQGSDPSVDSEAGIADIVVTAQKRSERIQDVPIAIAALTGDSLGAGEVTTIADVAQAIPGLQFNAVFAGSNPTIFLRGVGVNDYNAASSGAVGVSIDEVFLNSSIGQIFSIYDVERIEVLKGPQGTLFGRNTTGGIINVFTRQPSFETSIDVAFTLGSYNQRFADGAIGGALVDGLLAARTSVTWHRRDGWARNLVDGSRVNDIDSLGGRLQFLLTPAEGLEVVLKLEAGRSDTSAYRGKSGGVFDVAGGRPCTGREILEITRCANPLTGFVDTADLGAYQTNVTDNYEDLRTRGVRLGVDWDLGGSTLTSITAFNHNRRALNQDQDMSPFRILESPLWSDRSEQFSQEIRLASDGDGRVRWVAGAFFLRDALESYTDFELLAGFAPSSAPFFDPLNSIFTVGRRFTQKTDSKALFAQADFDLTDALVLTTGFRYTWDRKKLDFITFGGPVNNPGRLLTTPLIGLLDSDPASLAIDDPIRKDDRFNEPTWRLALAWKPSADALLYASYTRGFRSGGWNSGALVSPIEFTFVDSERNDAFEAGFKSDFMDRTVRLNGAAFYYNYKDMQVFTLQPGTPVPFQRLQNADARIFGAEVDVTLQPAEGLQLRGAVVWLNTEYTRLLDAISGDLSGNRLEKSPEWQLSAGATYEADLSERMVGRAQADLTYQSSMFLSPTNRAPQVRDAHTVVNAEVGLRDRTSGLSATLFVKNLFAKRFVQDMFDVSSFGSFAIFYNEPRTGGVTIGYRY
jgi:iron complex outermembrane receptor protein